MAPCRVGKDQNKVPLVSRFVFVFFAMYCLWKKLTKRFVSLCHSIMCKLSKNSYFMQPPRPAKTVSKSQILSPFPKTDPRNREHSQVEKFHQTGIGQIETKWWSALCGQVQCLKLPEGRFPSACAHAQKIATTKRFQLYPTHFFFTPFSMRYLAKLKRRKLFVNFIIKICNV